MKNVLHYIFRDKLKRCQEVQLGTEGSLHYLICKSSDAKEKQIWVHLSKEEFENQFNLLLNAAEKQKVTHAVLLALDEQEKNELQACIGEELVVPISVKLLGLLEKQDLLKE